MKHNDTAPLLQRGRAIYSLTNGTLCLLILRLRRIIIRRWIVIQRKQLKNNSLSAAHLNDDFRRRQSISLGTQVDFAGRAVGLDDRQTAPAIGAALVALVGFLAGRIAIAHGG